MAEKKRFRTDALAFASNISSSVLLIYSNKFLMSGTVGYGFRFGEPNSHCTIRVVTLKAPTAFCLWQIISIRRQKVLQRGVTLYTFRRQEHLLQQRRSVHCTT
jgi:hypothetical protein